jgi:lipopolysaccharide/colanic/teichoic acid biosynthesis glycosyltransferase
VATSERILTPIVSAATTQYVSSHRFTPPSKPVWRQALLDSVVVYFGLAVCSLAFGHRAATALGDALPLLSLTMMMTVILAFTRAYPRQPSPLDIQETEGVLRGLACAATLMMIGGIGTRTLPVEPAFLTAAVVSILLVLQREIAHGFRAHRSSRHLSRLDPLEARAEMHAEVFVIDARPELAILPSSASGLAKRVVDVTLASASLLALSPLWLLVAVLIKLDSRGPVLLRQRRIGRCGRPFEMWKFRSMHADVNRYARSPVSDTDPRMTRVGRRIRRLSIDELPQLLNVLQGDMSLVGPRPEMPFIVERYQPHERLRLNATPGITGIWQISPARALPIHQNLHLDLFYIENRNIFLDLAILLRTVTAVVRGIGAT